jgi:hypothetical protein
MNANVVLAVYACASPLPENDEYKKTLNEMRCARKTAAQPIQSCRVLGNNVGRPSRPKMFIQIFGGNNKNDRSSPKLVV